jgi:hypothetical protein
MGNAAGISATEVEKLAGSLEALTATEAESIQEGANLLLTFGNIRNEFGAGNDIFTQTTKIMVDLGVALKRGPVQTATMLGKALNDPIRGMTALTRVGVSFTDEQRNQVKALQQTGDLMGAQKIILAELQRQYGGSGAAFAQTFTGQLQLMGHELGTIGEEATMAVMPALQGMVSELRELIPLIGPQLKSAIESVDWKALTTSVVNLTTFFVQHGATLAKVVVGIFALNTAFKLMQVAIGISTVAIQLKTWYLAQLTAGMTATTIATGALSTAMRLIPWLAVAGGIAYLSIEIAKAETATDKLKAAYESVGGSATKTDNTFDALATTATDLRMKLIPVLGIIKDIANFLGLIPKETTVKINVESNLPTSNPRAGDLDLPTGAPGVIPGLDTLPSGGGGGSKPKTLSIGQQLKREATVVKKQTKLIGAGLSEGLAARLTSGAAPVKRANKALAAIQKNNGKLTKNLRKMEKNLAISTKVAVDSVAEQVAVIQDTSVQDALDAKERAYQSFADSVKNTFASIKDSILGAFDLTQLGGSTNAITRNMDKLLVRLRSFATNVSKLSGMGLNASLLQQVISAGPMAGARLAESLVMGGTGALAAINAGYSEFGLLSGQIAQTGTEAMFNRTEQGSVYNINVDGGVGSGATIGKAIVDAIKAYERTSGAVFQGA